MNYKVFTGTSNPLLDTRIQELQLYGEAGTTIQLIPWLGVDVNLTYREREERHNVTEQDGFHFPCFNVRNDPSNAWRILRSERVFRPRFGPHFLTMIS